MEAKQEKGALVAAFPAELPALESFSLDELRREWRRLYYNEPPRISRDLLMLRERDGNAASRASSRPG
jgi:hypothetical protein